MAKLKASLDAMIGGPPPGESALQAELRQLKEQLAAEQQSNLALRAQNTDMTKTQEELQGALELHKTFGARQQRGCVGGATFRISDDVRLMMPGIHQRAVSLVMDDLVVEECVDAESEFQGVASFTMADAVNNASDRLLRTTAGNHNHTQLITHTTI